MMRAPPTTTDESIIDVHRAAARPDGMMREEAAKQKKFTPRCAYDVYRLHLVEEYKSQTTKWIVHNILEQLYLTNMKPDGIMRVGDTIEITYEDLSTDWRRRLDELCFEQCGVGVHLEHDNHNLVIINIRGNDFRDPMKAAGNLVRHAGRIVNAYRQTNAYRGDQLENGIIAIWMRDMTDVIPMRFDKRRSCFYNKIKYRAACQEINIQEPAAAVEGQEGPRESKEININKEPAAEVKAQEGPRESKEININKEPAAEMKAQEGPRKSTEININKESAVEMKAQEGQSCELKGARTTTTPCVLEGARASCELEGAQNEEEEEEEEESEEEEEYDIPESDPRVLETAILVLENKDYQFKYEPMDLDLMDQQKEEGRHDKAYAAIKPGSYQAMAVHRLMKVMSRYWAENNMEVKYSVRVTLYFAEINGLLVIDPEPLEDEHTGDGTVSLEGTDSHGPPDKMETAPSIASDDEKHHMCGLCSKKFLTLEHLKAHVVNKHPDTEEDAEDVQMKEAKAPQKDKNAELEEKILQELKQKKMNKEKAAKRSIAGKQPGKKK